MTAQLVAVARTSRAIAALVSWSATITPAASHSQRDPARACGRESACASASRERRDARRLRTGSTRSGRTASGAPRPRRRRRGSASSARTSACALGVTRDRQRRRPRATRGRRRDQHEAQVVAEARERVVARRRGAAIATSACSDEPIVPRLAQRPRAPSARRRAPRRMRCPLADQRRRRPAAAGNASVQVWQKIVASSGLHDAPRLLGGERQDRRHQPQQRVADRARARSAPSAARALSVPRRVEAVLQHVEVEAAEVLRAERLQPLHDEVELVARVVGRDARRRSARACASA